MTITIEVFVGSGDNRMSKTVTFEDVTAESAGTVAAMIERILAAWSE